jgi:hypothetical protein
LHLHSVLGLNAQNSLSSLLQTVSSGTSSTVAAATEPASSQTSISPMGKIMGELQQLAMQNPTEFKSLTSQFSAQLTSLASSSTGGQASFLTKLAAKFQSASQSGTVSGLIPSTPTSSGYTATGASSSDPVGSALSGLLNLFGSSSSSTSGSTGASTTESSSSSTTNVSGIFNTLQQELAGALGGSSSLSASVSLLA